MSNSVFLKPDENGNWGSINVIGGGGSFSSLLTFQSGATGTGNGTANDVSGYDVLSLQVTFSATAAVTFEATVDGTTWSALQGYTPTALGQQSSTVGTSGIYRFIVTGMKLFRARISAYTSGTVDVTGYAAKGSFQIPYLTNSYGNADAQSATSLLQGTGSYILGYNGSTWDRLRTGGTGALRVNLFDTSGFAVQTTTFTADAVSGGFQSLCAESFNMGWNGATADRIRVGKTYKYLEFNAFTNLSSQTIWTPTAGKRFRLMGISISCGAACSFKVMDGGVAFHQVRASGADTFTFDFGNGYSSTAVNNTLTVYNDSGATVAMNVTVFGTEEV